MAIRCPKCNQLNPREATHCQACRSPLVQVCPRCGTARPLGMAHCPVCEGGADDMEAFAQIFQEVPRQAIKGRYVVERVLARGAVDAVYRVRDLADNASYALKELSEIALLTGEEKRRARQAFQERVAFWAGLRHRNLVPILDSFSVGEKHYVLMPLVLGWNLAQIVRSRSLELGEETIRNWGAQLCDLLSYLHGQSPPIILGWLAPEQVMVTRQGVIQYIGFHLTQLFQPQREAAPRPAALSPYTAPEASLGGLSPAADVYALGMLLYALASRRLLTSGPPRPEAIRRAVPGISRQLEAIIARATRRDPGARFATVADLRQALWGEEEAQPQPLSTLVVERPAPPVAAAPAARAASSPAAPLPAEPPVVAATKAQPAAKPRLSVRPKRIAIEAVGPQERKETELVIYNLGQAELEGRLVSQVSWLALGANAFRLEPNRAFRVPVMILGARLPRGGILDPQAILVDSNAGRTWVSVEAKVSLEPILAVQEELLDLGTVQGNNEVSAQLTVTNAGGGVLEGTVQSRVPWLRVPHPDFRCAPQRQAQIQVLLKPEALRPGKHEEQAALIVDSDAGQVQIAVRVERVQPILAVRPLFLDFGALLPGEQRQCALSIANEGTGSLLCRLRSREPWIQVSPQPMQVPAGETRETAVVADAAHLPEGLTESAHALEVQSNAGTARVAARAALLKPKLALDQERLELGEVPLGEPAHGRLVVRNVGSAPLSCRLESLLDWLRVAPQEASLAPGEALEARVQADTSYFDRGQAVEVERALRVVSDGGERELGLRMLLLRPFLEVAPAQLDFGIVERLTPARRTLTLRNRDTGLLQWEIASEAFWVEVVPRQGHCRAGEEREAEVIAYGWALPPEAMTAEGALLISSNGGEQRVPLSITIASPQLDVDVNRLDLGLSVNYAELEGSFLILNHGLGTLRGRVIARTERLAVEPAEFECPTGVPQLVRVRARTEGLPAGHHAEKAGILVESNGGREELDIFYDVRLEPRLEVTWAPATPAEGGAPWQWWLTIKNVGGEAANVNVLPHPDRLEITRRSNTIKPGKAVRLRMTWRGDAAELPDELYVEITSQNEALRIPIEMEKPGPDRPPANPPGPGQDVGDAQ